MNASGATSIVPRSMYVFSRLCIEHVVERVEERSQIGIDLREHVAREKAEPLARLAAGPREDDTRNLTVLQCGNGEGHRQVRLAGARRGRSRK